MQQHEGQQSVRLGLVGHQLGQRLPEAQRLRGEVVAAGPAFVEDQIDHGQNRREPVGQQVIGRDAERDAGFLDLSLGAHQALGHGGLGDEEGAGDVGGREAAERAQGQGYLGVEVKCRMAAGENQLESLIWKGGLLHWVLRHGRCLEQTGLLRQGAVAADAIDGAAPGGGYEPGRGARRGAFPWPALGSAGKRLLRCFLGEGAF